MKQKTIQTISLYILQSALLFTCILFAEIQENYTITIIGTGYVGLVSGAGLAQFGNTVICADIDTNKIQILKNGQIPIYEPGLKEVVDQNVTEERLVFTSDVDYAIQKADILFIAVGTPMGSDGSADMKYVESVVASIAKNMNKHKIIVTKSTVPIGTGARIRTTLEQEYQIDGTLFDIVSNPEFLREGCAVQDFLHADRIVVGTESEYATEMMHKIYQKPIDEGTHFVVTNLQTSEMIKYASNAFLATKLSFINEIANFCDVVGADAQMVGYAMGLDKRISAQFLKPGPGYGGSCFPKDTQALVYMAQLYGVNMQTVAAAILANKYQKTIPFKKLEQLFSAKTGSTSVAGKKIAVLGLAFKSNTDDIRYSPAITLIKELRKHGAHISAYDAAAMSNFKQLYPDITYCDSLYDAVVDADAVIIMTEWDEFKDIDIARLAELVNQRIIIDTRNMLNPEILHAHDFISDSIGTSYAYNK